MQDKPEAGKIEKRSAKRRARRVEHLPLATLREEDASISQVAETMDQILMQHGRLVLDKLSPRAYAALFSDQHLRDRFLASKSECSAFILSVDLRRSTELMLKARTAQLFGEFMAGLCSDLNSVICDNYGIVDKFTGDGLLASFPEFFSGADAGYRTLAAAEEAHRVFAKRYKRHRHSFSTILADVGLGIGIDYGDVRFMRIAGDLTVVGSPVVYATRMSNAPAGKTVLNQPAYEMIANRYLAFSSTTEIEMDIKHEGRILAYEVSLNQHSFVPAAPPWLGDS